MREYECEKAFFYFMLWKDSRKVSPSTAWLKWVWVRIIKLQTIKKKGTNLGHRPSSCHLSNFRVSFLFKETRREL